MPSKGDWLFWRAAKPKDTTQIVDSKTNDIENNDKKQGHTPEFYIIRQLIINKMKIWQSLKSQSLATKGTHGHNSWLNLWAKAVSYSHND